MVYDIASFVLIKCSKVNFEDYLNNLHDFESRKIVAKFRCSDHTLMTETGRHKKIDLEEKMCKICSQKRVEYAPRMPSL